MEKKQYAQRKHPVLDIPFVGPALLLVYGYAVSMVSVGVAYLLIPSPYHYCVGVLFGILMIVLHRLVFRNEFRGGLCTEGLNDKKLWIAFFIVVVADSLFYVHDIAECGFDGITAEGIAASLMAAVCEEVSDRYLPVSTMMRRYKKTGNFLPPLLFTSLLFSMSHLLNITSPEQVRPVMLQVLATLCSGLAMGALYIRTGNILLSMGWHFLHDFLSSMVVQVPTAGVSTGAVIETVLACICYVAFAVVLLIGQKDNVKKIWYSCWPESGSVAQDK